MIFDNKLLEKQGYCITDRFGNFITCDDNISECIELQHYFTEKFNSIHEEFITEGYYNFIKYDDRRFLSEASSSYTNSIRNLFLFMRDRVNEMYVTISNRLKSYNKDRTLSSAIIFILDNKDKINFKLNSDDYYDYYIPKDNSYLNHFKLFIDEFKSEFSRGIDRDVIKKYKEKYSIGSFDRIRGKIIGISSLNSMSFAEEVYKYFRNGSIDSSIMVVDKNDFIEAAVSFKNINNSLKELSAEYGVLNNLYKDMLFLISNIDKMEYRVNPVNDFEKNTKEKEMLGRHYNKVYDDKEKLKVDYLNMKINQCRTFMTIYNIYFTDKLNAINNMYKSNYNKCMACYYKLREG